LAAGAEGARGWARRDEHGGGCERGRRRAGRAGTSAELGDAEDHVPLSFPSPGSSLRHAAVAGGLSFFAAPSAAPRLDPAASEVNRLRRSSNRLQWSSKRCVERSIWPGGGGGSGGGRDGGGGGSSWPAPLSLPCSALPRVRCIRCWRDRIFPSPNSTVHTRQSSFCLSNLQLIVGVGLTKKKT
jgi:hypothetical protein